MKTIKNIGFVLFLTGLAFFIGSIFTGSFGLTSAELETFIKQKGYKNEMIKKELSKVIVTDNRLTIFEFSSKVITAFERSNSHTEYLSAQAERLSAQAERLSAQAGLQTAQAKRLSAQAERLSVQAERLSAQAEYQPALAENLSALAKNLSKLAKNLPALQKNLPALKEKLIAIKNWDKEGTKYQYKIYEKPHSFSYQLAKKAGKGYLKDNPRNVWWFTFGLGIIGALLFILPNLILLGKPGVKNDGIYLASSTNQGVIAWFVLVYLVSFYLVLYFMPDYVVNWTYILDPISQFLSGNLASQWFVYGFLYCTIMLVMGARMYIKYRHNKYQIIRTTSVLFFQIVFAFLIPEIMTSLNMPGYDFKNAFPLDYDFFFEWNLESLKDSGGIGLFILVWGIVLTLVIVPVMVYFFGKRWYCSWVCGCGGLAETLGDPYRQHSSKKLRSWKLERWLIHSVLVFSLVMTIVVLYCYFSGTQSFLGIHSQWIKDTYSFLIGSWFAGVIGTGFYPIFGNRVWCRFGCPLAAYLGLVQRFKSRFRITTNGGQCISCGNCSTYCEQGIDVRAYAQKGENIVRSSCVGCGICSAVCPRGVLKLENGPEDGRINPTEILLGNDVDLMNLVHQNLIKKKNLND